MADSTLSKGVLLKDLEEKVITKQVQDLLRDSTPLQMIASVILCFSFLCVSMFMFVFADNYYFI